MTIATQKITRNPKAQRQRRENRRSEPVIQKARQSVYMNFSGDMVTYLLVTEDRGNYTTLRLNPQASLENKVTAALADALSKCTWGTDVYVFVGAQRNAQQSRLIREWITPRRQEKGKGKPNRPREIDQVARQRGLRLSTGSIGYLEPMWQNLILKLEDDILPETRRMVNYQIHSYAVADGIRTHASAVLYGEGQIYVTEHHARLNRYEELQQDLRTAEMRAVEQALKEVAGGKTVEIHHTDPNIAAFWTDTQRFLDRHPYVGQVAQDIGTHISRGIRFEVASERGDNVMDNVPRWMVGRSLGAALTDAPGKKDRPAAAPSSSKTALPERRVPNLGRSVPSGQVVQNTGAASPASAKPAATKRTAQPKASSGLSLPKKPAKEKKAAKTQAPAVAETAEHPPVTAAPPAQPQTAQPQAASSAEAVTQPKSQTTPEPKLTDTLTDTTADTATLNVPEAVQTTTPVSMQEPDHDTENTQTVTPATVTETAEPSTEQPAEQPAAPNQPSNEPSEAPEAPLAEAGSQPITAEREPAPVQPAASEAPELQPEPDAQAAAEEPATTPLSASGGIKPQDTLILPSEFE